MESARGLKVVDLQMSDLMRTMENAIQFGSPVLLQDVLEEIDPSLEPILAKSFIKKGNQVRSQPVFWVRLVGFQVWYELYRLRRCARWCNLTPILSARSRLDLALYSFRLSRKSES
jgi:hypothetical protein